MQLLCMEYKLKEIGLEVGNGSCHSARIDSNTQEEKKNKKTLACLVYNDGHRVMCKEEERVPSRRGNKKRGMQYQCGSRQRQGPVKHRDISLNMGKDPKRLYIRGILSLSDPEQQ